MRVPDAPTGTAPWTAGAASGCGPVPVPAPGSTPPDSADPRLQPQPQPSCRTTVIIRVARQDRCGTRFVRPSLQSVPPRTTSTCTWSRWRRISLPGSEAR
ncbi:hypothetical protein ACFFX0_27365 [Citricoccus parietis]|uniref:Uncharacterized protein n=1 Tax=Citricoccus parietis TaxID=592307 RepID=A0ABV5G6Y1_9MICC